MAKLQPHAFGLCLTLITLAACDDAVLGAFPETEGGAAPIPLSARNLTLSGDCPPARRSVHIEGWRGAPGAPELHVIGLRDDPGPEPARIYVSRETEMVVAISSPRGARWEVVASNNARVERVLVSGAGAEVDAGPVPVEVLGVADLGCAYRYPPEGPECNSYAFIYALEQITGRPLSSFQGCMTGRRFGLLSQQPARWDESAGVGEASFSSDALAVAVDAASREAPGVRATTPLFEGRWYFEVALFGRTTQAKVGVGVASGWLDRGVALEGIGWGVAYSPAGVLVRNPELPGPGISGPPLDEGSRVGIAVDLDRDQLWVRVNGSWVGPSPSGEGATLGLYSGVLPLYPAVFLGPGLSAQAHFADGNPPPGFRPLSEAVESP